MAVLKVKKATLYAHQSVAEDIVAELQKLSSCEVMPLEDAGADGKMEVVARKLREIDDISADARFLLRFLEPYYEDERGTLDRLLSDKPSVTIEELEKLVAKIELKEIAGQARKIERRLVELRSALSNLDSKRSVLSTLEGFPHDLSLLSRGTKNVTSLYGTIPSDQVEKLKTAFVEAAGDQGELFFGSREEKALQVPVVMLYDKAVAADVSEASAAVTFSRIDFPKNIAGTVVEEMKRVTDERNGLLEEEEQLKSSSRELADLHIPSIRKLFDYFAVLHKRYEALLQGERTSNVSIIRLWIPESALKAFRQTIKPYEAQTEVIVEDPDISAGDDPPVLLKNPKWALPFEPLTRLYGLPVYGRMDPTVPMAPFMFIFLGMCLGDGGYGIFLAGLILWFFSRYRITGEKKNFFNLLLLGTVSTTAFGAITGSWLGDMIDAFEPLSFLIGIKNSVVLLRPMENPLNFLGISLALGVIQVLFGLFLAMWENLRKGDYIAAFGDQGGWIALIMGLLVYAGAAADILAPATGFLGKVLSFVGVGLLITTQGREKTGFINKAVSGVMSLYNITSYLGDVLSYSRLLALGLATSAVAMIINTLTGLVIDIPFVGMILAVILFIGGHLFSVTVNTLGAFIHALRLQYVEFFSKFYGGGGRALEPLAYDTQYVQVKPVGAEKVL
ncbi:MAG: V-type ATP synthase subunit I [Thermovirgaceae bacterium]